MKSKDLERAKGIVHYRTFFALSYSIDNAANYAFQHKSVGRHTGRRIALHR